MRGYVGKTFYVIEGIGHVGPAGRRQQAELRGQRSDVGGQGKLISDLCDGRLERFQRFERLKPRTTDHGLC
jgi:hypothetical protein